MLVRVRRAHRVLVHLLVMVQPLAANPSRTQSGPPHQARKSGFVANQVAVHLLIHLLVKVLAPPMKRKHQLPPQPNTEQAEH